MLGHLLGTLNAWYNIYMKRMLFIDGSNLYGGLGELLQPGTYINFGDFLKVIKQDFDYDEVRFYGTYMRIDAKHAISQQMRAKAQVEFFNNVRECPKVTFIEGHFSPSSGKEKGVDVKLASDMVLGAATHTFDEAMIMTGDADLLYAVQLVRQLKIPVFMGAFASRFPFQMVYHVDKRFVYDYNHHFEKKVVPSFRKKLRNIIVREIADSTKVLSVTL